MVRGWMFSAAGAAFTTAWSYHEGKFFGLPKLDRKVGIPVTIGLILLSAYLYKKEHSVFMVPPSIHIPSRAFADYAHNPSPPAREPIGYLTGPGLDDKNKPASSIVKFPDNVALGQRRF